MWSTGNFHFIPTEESAANKWLYTATNFGTGLCSGYAVGPWETRGAASVRPPDARDAVTIASSLSS